MPRWLWILNWQIVVDELEELVPTLASQGPVRRKVYSNRALKSSPKLDCSSRLSRVASAMGSWLGLGSTITLVS